MSTPLLFWLLVFGAFVIVLALRLTAALIHHLHGRHHIFEAGTEREIVYIPGDPLHPDENDYEDDEYV